MPRPPFESGQSFEIGKSNIRVVVVSDPGSNPPDWVRYSWIGVEFDATPVCNPFGDYRESPGLEPVEPRPFWQLPAIEAIEALRMFGHNEAAKWWIENGYYDEGMSLAFPIISCSPVDGSEVVFPDLN